MSPQLEVIARHRLLPVMGLAVLVLLLYGQTLGFSYVWDDGIIFLDKNDLMVKPLSWGLLSQPVLEGTSYLRPVVFLTWFTEFHLFGQRPALSHAVNVGLFLLNVILLFQVALTLFQRNGLSRPMLRAVAAAAIYAVHPALIEVVAWVSGRFDLLCTTFILLAIKLYLADRMSVRVRIPLMCALMLLAVLTKELGVVLPALLLCIGLALRNPDTNTAGANGLRAVSSWFKQERSLCMALGLTMVVYFVIRKLSMDAVYHAPISLDYWITAVFELMMPLEALREYVLIALLPFDRISIFYPLAGFDLGAAARLPLNMLSLLTVCMVVYLGFWRLRLWALMLIAALISISLVIHLIPMTIADNLVQTRFLALPLAFAALAIASVNLHGTNGQVPLFSGLRQRVVVGGISVLWLLGAALVSYTTIPMWSNSLSLWTWVHKQHADIASVSYNYAQAALAGNRLDLAEAEMKRLIDRDGGLDVPHQILYGNFLLRKGDPEAQKYIQGVLYAIPDFRGMENGFRKIQEYGLTHTQIGGALMDYANSQIVFLGDLQAALRYNELSAWYYREGERVPVKLQRAVIFYLMGRFDEADRLRLEVEGTYYHNSTSYLAGAFHLVRTYCDRWEKAAESGGVCENLERRVLPQAFKISP